MTAKDPEAIAAALQLLMGDVSDDEKRALFYRAFPESFILVRGDAARTRARTTDISRILEDLLAMADGSTPLGIIAVGQVRDKLQAAKNDLNTVRTTLGL